MLVLGLQVYILVVPSTVLPMLMVDRGMLGGSRQSAVRSKLQDVKRFKISQLRKNIQTQYVYLYTIFVIQLNLDFFHSINLNFDLLNIMEKSST